MLTLDPNEMPPQAYHLEGPCFFDYAAPCTWGLVPFYRLRNPGSGEHFYTAAPSEKSALLGQGWEDQGDVGCIDPQPECGNTPLFRLLSPDGWHLFTASASERDGLVAQGWKLEHVAGYVWPGP
jgi:hypothetical protein